MSDVRYSIGTENSKIENSTIVVGDDNVTEKGNQIIVHDLESLAAKVAELANRVDNIEKLLGGNLGIPGLTAQVLGIKDMVLDIKQEISEIKVRESTRISYGNFIVLALSVGAMCIAVLSTALGLWK